MTDTETPPAPQAQTLVPHVEGRAFVSSLHNMPIPSDLGADAEFEIRERLRDIADFVWPKVRAIEAANQNRDQLLSIHHP